MKINRKKNILILIFISGITFFVFPETYNFSSDSLSTIISQGKERTLLKGNVSIESEKKKIKAEVIELWGENFRYFSGEGKVNIKDKEKNIMLSSDSFFYDKIDDIMRLNGLVVMEDYENEMVVKCQSLENRGSEDMIILQIGVRILKKDIVCRSEFAVYYRETEMLELTGLPVVYKGEDTYQADKIIVNLETEEITMEGEVEGSLITEDDKHAAKNEGTDETPAAQVEEDM